MSKSLPAFAISTVLLAALLAACGSTPLSQVSVADRGVASGTVSKVETIEPGRNATYLYTVQLDGGDLWTFTYASDQGLRAGQRVRVVDGALQHY